jgi:transposase
MGHTVKQMPAGYVKAYVKSNKNDEVDAEAICEAVRRPNMRFVPIKDENQQAILMLHRARALLINQRLKLTNAMRGLLLEFGVAVRRGELGTKEVLQIIERKTVRNLPKFAVEALMSLAGHFRSALAQIASLDEAIMTWHHECPQSMRLDAIPGIGPLTATALVATIGNGSNFRSGRQLAAWIGLVPRQHSSGGKAKLRGISKRGDRYLRRLLYAGAMVLISRNSKQPLAKWGKNLHRRKPFKVAAVALANKLARVAWALLAHNDEYRATAKS